MREYNEFHFRKLIPLTTEEYRAEPARKVRLFLRFAEMDAQLEAEEMDRRANGGR